MNFGRQGHQTPEENRPKNLKKLISKSVKFRAILHRFLDEKQIKL